MFGGTLVALLLVVWGWNGFEEEKVEEEVDLMVIMNFDLESDPLGLESILRFDNGKLIGYGDCCDFADFVHSCQQTRVNSRFVAGELCLRRSVDARLDLG